MDGFDNRVDGSYVMDWDEIDARLDAGLSVNDAEDGLWEQDNLCIRVS